MTGGPARRTLRKLDMWQRGFNRELRLPEANHWTGFRLLLREPDAIRAARKNPAEVAKWGLRAAREGGIASLPGDVVRVLKKRVRKHVGLGPDNAALRRLEHRVLGRLR